jgi:flotillin
MSIDEINRDRIKFESNIRDHCEHELKKIGLGLINVNIINIEDESGVIEAMGQKAAAEAVQKAVVDVALHEKEGAIGKETEDTEKAIQVASLTRDREIGMKNAQITAAIRTAELDAERVKGENEAAKLRAESDSLLQTARAKAYRSGETSEKEAEAGVVEAENIARAKAAQAEAKRIEEEKRAELEAPAKAQKAKVTIDAEARAAKLKIEADAEAHALMAKYKADARGEYERLARKAEGLGMIVQNCGGADKAFQLLMLEQLQPLAKESAKAISNLNFDKVVVWENGGSGSGNGGSSTSNFVRNLTSAVPPAMDVLKHVGGFENIEQLMPSTDSAAVTGPMKDYQNELMETFRGIFDAYDNDRDGRIDRDEFHQLLNSPALEEFKSLRDGMSDAKSDLESRIDRNGGLLFSDIEEVISMEFKKHNDLSA